MGEQWRLDLSRLDKLMSLFYLKWRITFVPKNDARVISSLKYCARCVLLISSEVELFSQLVNIVDLAYLGT